jgi:Uma2 family endonuclease
MVAQVEKPAQIDKSVVSTDVQTRLYTPEEYLEMEVLSEERHEFRDGEIIPMAGATPNHNRVTLNVASVLNFAFKGTPYEVFSVDQRLWIPKKRLYTYPDVLVIQGELELQVGRQDSVINPLVIIEVLSKSTAEYDRQEKFRAYRTIPTFHEYLLIDQYSQHVEHYVKVSAKKWDFQEYDETDTVVQLGTIDLALALADIYDKVNFEAEEIEAAPMPL